MSELDRGTLEDLVSMVSRGLETVTIASKNLHCEGDFDPARKQWLANSMIDACVRRFASRDCFAVGLTEKDLYVSGLNFVFGLAVREAGAAIVSWHRLAGDEGAFTARTAKEVIHEVGHLEGLNHCPNEDCVMWFSNTLWETDRKEAEFCQRCERRRLLNLHDAR